MYLSQAVASDDFALKGKTKYVSKVVAPTRELLILLENDTPERIEMYYQFNKQVFCNLTVS